MKNKFPVETNLTDLIAKIGEKITIRRASFFDTKNGVNSFYIHGAIEPKIGKIISIVKISKKDTSISLAKKVLKQEHKLYPAAIKKLFN